MRVKTIIAGRLNRKNFALGYLALIGFALVLGLLSIFVPPVLYFLFLAVMVFSASVLIIKRLHDLGMSGSNLIVLYIFSFVANLAVDHTETILQIAGLLISIGLVYFTFFRKGEQNDNKYGVVDRNSNFIDAIFNNSKHGSVQ